MLAYYAGVIDQQDELHAGLFLVDGRLVMNYAEALEVYARTPDYYFDNPLYHIFAITSLTLSATILYIFAKNAREPFTNHRRLTIISIILVTVASVLLLRVIDPLIRIRLG